MQWNDLPAPVRFALDRLEQHGHEAALVGGCVRDRLMGRMPGDYDITTSATPEQTQAAFADLRTIPTGLKHGTVTVLLDGMPMEITTFRQDGEYTDMRRPDSVRFTRSLQQDVARRDFTMNALAWELSRGLIDHTGGREDIACRCIRAVGDPHRRFAEDALRILRAVRFSAQLGFAVEQSTKRALFDLAGNIDRIAAERVRVELEKTLLGPGAVQALTDYRDVLRPRLPGGSGISDAAWAEAAAVLSAVKTRSNEPVLLWAALLSPLGAQNAAQALKALKCDNSTAFGVQKRLEMAQEPMETLYSLRCMAGDNGLAAAGDAVILRYALAPEKAENAQKLLEKIQTEALPCSLGELAVSGRDLLALGVKGKAVGQVLSRLLDSVRAGETENQKTALLERAKSCRN